MSLFEDLGDAISNAAELANAFAGDKENAARLSAGIWAGLRSDRNGSGKPEPAFVEFSDASTLLEADSKPSLSINRKLEIPERPNSVEFNDRNTLIESDSIADPAIDDELFGGEPESEGRTRRKGEENTDTSEVSSLFGRIGDQLSQGLSPSPAELAELAEELVDGNSTGLTRDFNRGRKRHSQPDYVEFNTNTLFKAEGIDLPSIEIGVPERENTARSQRDIAAPGIGDSLVRRHKAKL